MRKSDVKTLFVEKTKAELLKLEAQGLRMGGNCFSEVLLVKHDEQGQNPFSGEDGKALSASLLRLGYAPEDWEWLLLVKDDGSVVSCEELRLAIATLDPASILLCDEASAELFKNSFADELAELDDLKSAMLSPGSLAFVLGMRVLALGDFLSMLKDDADKQRAWRWLKQLPHLAEPY